MLAFVTKTSSPPNAFVSLCCSLNQNNLTNRGKDMSGVIKLAEALTENTTLQNLRCFAGLALWMVRSLSTPNPPQSRHPPLTAL